MKLYEMMDRTPLPGRDPKDIDEKNYLAYMKTHRPDYFNGLLEFISGFTNNPKELENILSAVNLGADMALLQVLQHGMPEDLAEVYPRPQGQRLWRPGG